MDSFNKTPLEKIKLLKNFEIMKRLILINSIALILFLIISSVALYLEASFIESTSELIAIISYIVFFVVLLYINRNAIIKFENKYKKIAINTIIAISIFIFGFALSYILNWHLLVPVFNI